MECVFETKDYVFHVNKIGTGLIDMCLSQLGIRVDINTVLYLNKKFLRKLQAYVQCKGMDYLAKNPYTYFHIADCLSSMLLLMSSDEKVQVRFC